MDLLKILQDRLDTLAPGEYTIGLRAVLQHVQVAANHLLRGEKTGDDTAFTDAIYRTNQAFEGSLKEAYRVLAGKDPAVIRPFDIENFFQEQGRLRPRVLTQFSRYRTEWRNPSTHDYRLDFDGDEALLAIVSVCAFAIVLIDQMSETLSFESARAAAEPIQSATDPSLSFADKVAEALQKFRFLPTERTSRELPRETEIIGAVAGYLTASIPGLQATTEIYWPPERPERIDILLTLGDKQLIVDVRRGYGHPSTSIQQGISQLSKYIALSSTKEAILYLYTDDIYTDDTSTKMGRIELPLPEIQASVIVVSSVSYLERP
jgi:hypothetical protein